MDVRPRGDHFTRTSAVGTAEVRWTTVWNLFAGCSQHAFITACMEHVTTAKSTHELTMLESSLADGALVIFSFVPDKVFGSEASLGLCRRRCSHCRLWRVSLRHRGLSRRLNSGYLWYWKLGEQWYQGWHRCRSRCRSSSGWSRAVRGVGRMAVAACFPIGSVLSHQPRDFMNASHRS